MRVVKAEALIEFRIDPYFGALPQPDAGINRGVEGFGALSAAREALKAHEGRPERGVGQPGKRGLTVNVEAVIRERECTVHSWHVWACPTLGIEVASSRRRSSSVE
jgi:hypothetical protein